MPFFARPLYLLLLIPALYLLWTVQKRSLVAAGKGLQIFWLVFRAIICILILLGLSGLEWERSVNRNETLILLDASGSITSEQQKEEIDAANRVISKIHSPNLAGIIVFGEDAAIERFPGVPFPLEATEIRISRRATNLEEAAKLANATFSSLAQKNLVVLSDGEDNLGDPESQFRVMKRNGVSMQAIYFPPPQTIEASIEGVRFPDEVHPNEPFELEVLTQSNQLQPALLQVFRNGSLLQEANVTLQPSGKQFFRLPEKLEERGLYHFEIQLKAEKDFRIENNREHAWLSVEGPPRILLMDSEPKNLEFLRSVLTQRGFDVDLRGPENFPSNLENFLPYQAVIVRDVPAAQIHQQMPLLEQYVRDFGGGFAMLGSEQSFGPGGYYQTPVEKMLPVRMDLINKKYLADVAMAIVIDKSGSMSYTDRGRQKIDLADEGAARVAEFLKKTDQLGVIAVDSVPKWVYPMQKLSDTAGAVEAITSIRAGGGGIYVYSGLREAYTALTKMKAPVKHVILFADTADCEEKESPSGESSLAVAERASRENRITTTTIGIGQTGDVDVEFLRQIAGLGLGRFYFTNDMFTLPEIFAQESSIVQRYYINNEKFTPRIVQETPLLPGIAAVPNLSGYVATGSKNLSTVNLISHRGDPVLSSWQYGLGRSVAFTSDPASTWSSNWKAWPGFERFWSQVVRYLSQGNSAPHFRASYDRTSQNATIVLDATDDAGNYLQNAQFEASFLDETGQASRLHFEQTAPGRYEARFRPDGAAFGKIVRLENGEISEQSLLQLPPNRVLEFRPSGRGRARLAQLTGRVLNSPDDIRFGSKSSLELQPLENQLLLIAAFLFLFDVAARKMDWRTLLRRPKAEAVQPVSPKAQALERLKNRKRIIEELRKPQMIVDLTQIKQQQTREREPEEDISEYMDRLKRAKQRSNE